MAGQGKAPEASAGLERIVRDGLDALRVRYAAEVTRLCGEPGTRYAPGSAPPYRRAGSRMVRIDVPDLFQKVYVRLPRVRFRNHPGEYDLSYLLSDYRGGSEVQRLIAERVYSGTRIRQMERGNVRLKGGAMAGVSPSQVSRAFRPLAEREADRIITQRLDDVKALILDATKVGKLWVISGIGITRVGEQVNAGLHVGAAPESGDTVGEYLRTLKAHGLHDDGRVLVVSDGGAGILAALRAELPRSPRQRCRAHARRNVIDNIPKAEKELREEVSRRLWRAWSYSSRRKARAALKATARDLYAQHPDAAKTIRARMNDTTVLQALRLNHLRSTFGTSNLIEAAFSVLEMLVKRITQWQRDDPERHREMVTRWSAAGLTEALRKAGRIDQAEDLAPALDARAAKREQGERNQAAKVERDRAQLGRARDAEREAEPPVVQPEPAPASPPACTGRTRAKGRPTARRPVRRRPLRRPCPTARRPTPSASRPRRRRASAPVNARRTPPRARRIVSASVRQRARAGSARVAGTPP